MNREDRFSELYNIARQAARAVTSAHPQFVNLEDMTQSAVLWLLERPQRVEHNTMPDGRLARNRLVSEVTRHLIGLAKAERREALGFDPECEYTYSTKLVEVVLPGVFDPTYRPTVLDRVEYSKPSKRAHVPHDPTSADNWTTFVMDVRRAVNAVCTDEDRRILFTRSVGGWTWDRFGQVYSQSGSSYRLRYHDALKRIVMFLNAGVVLESSPDGEVLAEAVSGRLVAVPRVDASTDWDVAGRDPYREPDA